MTFCHTGHRTQGKFLKLIYSIEKPFMYTAEDIRPMDIIITPTLEGILSTGLYRKPTHIDQYLQWESCHHIPAKYRVISTHTHRALQIPKMGIKQDTQ